MKAEIATAKQDESVKTAVMEKWNEVKDSWLWITNIWVLDGRTDPLPTYDGLTKLAMIEQKSGNSKQAENFRKLLLAMSDDIRVLLIKLADRLHNMRTMAYQSPEKQRTKSLETMEIYAPIAHRGRKIRHGLRNGDRRRGGRQPGNG